MSGHTRMEGCDRPWNHDDCPGIVHGKPGTFGGLVCHCPCHSLRRSLQRVEELAEFWESREDGTPDQISWAHNAAENVRAALDGSG